MNKAIYIRMPRCGSNSIVAFCKHNQMPFYGGSDMGFWGDNVVNDKDTPNALYKRILNHVGEEIYSDSFTFSSVRNPYSRAVSMYKHGCWSSAKNFKDFCTAIKNNNFPNDAAKWHSSTISGHIIEKEQLMVDYVIKIEDLQKHLDIICEKIKVPKQKARHLYKSDHKHYTEHYDEETKRIIAEKYAKDIEFFGYNFQ